MEKKTTNGYVNVYNILRGLIPRTFRNLIFPNYLFLDVQFFDINVTFAYTLQCTCDFVDFSKSRVKLLKITLIVDVANCTKIMNKQRMTKWLNRFLNLT